MEQPVVRRGVMGPNKAKAMTSKSKEDSRRRLQKNYILVTMMLWPYSSERGPWNTNRINIHWLKNLYKEVEEIAQSLISYPALLACFYDSSGWTFEVSKDYYTEACRHISERLDICSSFLKYVFRAYAPGFKEYTAISPVHRVSAGDKVAMLTGVFAGRYMCETGVTAGHLVADLDPQVEAGGVFQEVEFGGGIIGRCCGKESEVVIHGITYTADLAAISFSLSPEKPVCYNQFGEIDICGQTYTCRLWMGDKSSIMPGTEVWMMNQDGKLKIGIISRFLYYDKEVGLHNVMQIASKHAGESFSKKGDSGCCIFLPPSGGDPIVDVIGMVSSEVIYEKARLTNGILLGTVLPQFFRNLAPLCFTGPHSLTRHGNLPYGVDFSEGLEFIGSVGKFENLNVEPEQPVYPKTNDTGIGLLTEAEYKDSGPSGGLFESYSCIPVECSERSQTADSIHGDCDILENIDTGTDTLTSLSAAQRY